MQKLLAAFLWCASAWAVADASMPKEAAAPLLTEQEVRNPQFVAQWLGSASAKGDHKSAKWFFSLGLKEKKARNWSGASKAFGESARRYPSPQALLEYADADLKMLGQVRAREGFPPQLVQGDMAHALGFYEASLAGHGVTKTLSPQELQRVEQHVSCLKTYLQSSQVPSDCPPATYFSTGQAKK